MIKRKIKNRIGMTLSEVLIAVLLLTLATAIVTTCIRLGTGLFEKQKRVSEAQMLLDALVVSIQDELRYATGIYQSTESGNATDLGFRYSSRNRAGEKNCTIEIVAAGSGVNNAGHIVVRGSNTSYELVNGNLYDKLDVTVMAPENSVEGTWDGRSFHIRIEIRENGSSDIITYKEFVVDPFNYDYTPGLGSAVSEGD